MYTSPLHANALRASPLLLIAPLLLGNDAIQNYGKHTFEDCQIPTRRSANSVLVFNEHNDSCREFLNLHVNTRNTQYRFYDRRIRQTLCSMRYVKWNLCVALQM